MRKSPQIVPNVRQKLTALRALFPALGIDAFLVPRTDENQGEYVPASAERLAWLSGFTGSAGLGLVLADQAALFVDGRYTLQAAAETDPTLWQRHHLIEQPAPAWAAQTLPGARLGYDPWLVTEPALERFIAAGLRPVKLAANPIDSLWTNRPAPPADPVFAHDPAHAGLSAAEKIARIAADLRAADTEAAVLIDPASICWLLNMRGTDVPYTPFALCFALVAASGQVDLFIDPARIPAALRAAWGTQVRPRPRAELPVALAALAGQRVRLDPATTPAFFAQALRAAGATIAPGEDPCALPRACKNPTEQQGARAAHARDGQALCRFLHWLADTAPRGDQSELGAAAHLCALRAELPGFFGESFPAISAAGAHGAIVHYRVTADSDQPLGPDMVYLIDSGGQYRDGTTDVTRTIWTGPNPAPAALREQATRVLQGHIAIASLRFPAGIAGPHIDALARRALWEVGLDYDHGTGHGVGSFLSVHEGPAGISRTARPVALAPGMILSDEPGYYRTGAYGIRLENLLLVRPAEPGAGGRVFLCFETLTLAPFDRALIAPELMTRAEITWLDAYHARVLREIGPHLAPPVREWLAGACAPLDS